MISLQPFWRILSSVIGGPKRRIFMALRLEFRGHVLRPSHESHISEYFVANIHCGRLASALEVQLRYCIRLHQLEPSVEKMGLASTWAGRVFGTHTGNIALKLSGEDKALAGVLRHNDPLSGLTVYTVSGTFDGLKLELQGHTDRKVDDIEFSPLTASATLQQNGSLRGEWETTAGAGGSLELWPHDGSRSMPADVAIPDQMHTARHQFGPIVLERVDAIEIADDIQKELPKARIVVTFDTGAEQSRYLPDFKAMNFSTETAGMLKIHGAEADPSGIDRVLSVEFGQNYNVATAQSVSRAWSLGALENLRGIVQRHQRAYAKAAYGNVVANFILLATVVALPSMDTLMQRAILMLVAVAVIYAVGKFHARYMPNAAIYLGERTEGPFYKAFQSLGVYLLGALGSIIVLLAGAYLKGYLRLT